ncbi:MAG: DNA-binding protein WhiA [Clostridia bacterium]|nr:DNA-binding protein WhiA [Clostridia bacterium]MDE7328938.1 DNA-binding protein WhiA [Clostridia bacterium]
MDYTLELREDILKTIPAKGKCKLAFLCAVTKCRAGIDIYRKSITLTYEFEDKPEALAIVELIKEQVEGDVFFTQKGTGQNIKYAVQLKDSVANAFLALLKLSRFEGEEFIVDDGSEYISSITQSEEFFAFFKGLALSQGQLRFPDGEYSNYCLQIKTSDGHFAEAVREKMAEYDVDLKISVTKTNYILQSRNSKEIEDMLAMCGATNCIFKLNNVIAEREQSNEFNRQSNLYMANLARAVSGASKYKNAIEFLSEKGILQQQDRKLRDVAKARIEYEDDSMRELAEKLSMSKTSLARYLNRLLELEEEYNGRK